MNEYEFSAFGQFRKDDGLRTCQIWRDPGGGCYGWRARPCTRTSSVHICVDRNVASHTIAIRAHYDPLPFCSCVSCCVSIVWMRVDFAGIDHCCKVMLRMFTILNAMVENGGRRRPGRNRTLPLMCIWKKVVRLVECGGHKPSFGNFTSGAEDPVEARRAWEEGKTDQKRYRPAW